MSPVIGGKVSYSKILIAFQVIIQQYLKMPALGKE